MTRRPVLLLLLGLVLGATGPLPARAHEGEDHAKESTPVAAGAGEGTAVAVSDVHELVVRAGDLHPGAPATLRLLLADRDTNAPSTGAALELSGGARDTTWTARAEAPGVYVADVVFPDTGAVHLDVLVRQGEELDLLAVEGLWVGAPHRAAAAQGPGFPWGIGAFAVAGLLALLAWTRRAARRPRRGTGIAALLVALALGAAISGTARSHEGESHGDEKAPAADRARRGVPPGARYVAKEAQFELGLLTAVAHAEDLAETEDATGIVAADPAGSVDLIAPQGGKFVARRAWQVGDRIGRGQALGGILVVDELPVRAPITGTIVALGAVPGQGVAAGQVLARVVDLSRVRVELSLYGAALARGLGARSATVRIVGVAGPGLSARVVGLAPGGSPAGGPGAPLVLTVHDAKSLLRPGMVVAATLDLPGRVRAVTVPAAALVETEDGPAVFVKVAPEAFVLRAVTRGPRAGERIGLLQGVADGERIVVAGGAPLLSTAETPR